MLSHIIKIIYQKYRTRNTSHHILIIVHILWWKSAIDAYKPHQDFLWQKAYGNFHISHSLWFTHALKPKNTGTPIDQYQVLYLEILWSNFIHINPAIWNKITVWSKRWCFSFATGAAFPLGVVPVSLILNLVTPKLTLSFTLTFWICTSAGH